MELKEHLDAILTPTVYAMCQALEGECVEMVVEMEDVIAEAKESDDYEEVADMLALIVCETADEFGKRENFAEEFHPPLKALVGHVLAECPAARGILEEKLEDYPELKTALL